MTTNQDSAGSISIGMDTANFSNSDHQAAAQAATNLGYTDVSVGSYSAKSVEGIIATIAISISGLAYAAGRLGLTKLGERTADLFFEQVLQERLTRLFSRFKSAESRLQVLIGASPYTITLSVETSNDLDQALRLQEDALRLEDRTNLPFDPNSVQWAGYSDGTWHLRTDIGLFDYDLSSQSFVKHVWPQVPEMTEEELIQWFRDTYGVDPEKQP